MKQYDVIIIGGGIVGLSSAYYLGKAGKSVLVLEKGNGADGCSFGNAGFVSPSHFIPLSAPGIVSKGLKWMLSASSPFYVNPRLNLNLMRWGMQFMKHATDKHVQNSKNILADLSLASRALHVELAKEGGANLEEKGIVMLCNTEETLKHEIEIGAIASDLGMKSETLTMEGLNTLDPGIKKNALGGVFFPMDAHADPNQFMQKFPEILKPYDVTVIYGAEVNDFEYSNGKITSVSVHENQYKADQYVMAAGSFSPSMLKKLNLNLILEPGKGYSIDWKNPVAKPSVSYILVEARVAVTPFKDRVRIAGTMELNGLNQQVNYTRANGFIKSVENYFPEYKFEHLKELPVWAGLRPCSPDGLPYIGRAKKYSNLILATGHAMLGFTLGPVTGQLVKEIAMEEKTFLEIDKLSANRY